MWHYDERQKHAKIVNGLTVKSFLSKYEYGEDLEVALMIIATQLNALIIQELTKKPSK